MRGAEMTRSSKRRRRRSQRQRGHSEWLLHPFPCWRGPHLAEDAMWRSHLCSNTQQLQKQQNVTSMITLLLPEAVSHARFNSCGRSPSAGGAGGRWWRGTVAQSPSSWRPIPTQPAAPAAATPRPPRPSSRPPWTPAPPTRCAVLLSGLCNQAEVVQMRGCIWTASIKGQRQTAAAVAAAHRAAQLSSRPCPLGMTVSLGLDTSSAPALLPSLPSNMLGARKVYQK
jgi:hypothetical protein